MVKPAPAVKCDGETDAQKRPSRPLSRVLRARRGSCMSSASACGQLGRPRGRGASWRSGYAEDCKSLYGGSIPSEASSEISMTYAKNRPESDPFSCRIVSQSLPLISNDCQTGAAGPCNMGRDMGRDVKSRPSRRRLGRSEGLAAAQRN